MDDEAENRKFLDDLLTPLGFACACAADGRAALQQVAAFQPHLVLLDLKMPLMDGFTAARQIRQHPDGSDVAIIALSASARAETAQQSLAAGCQAYVEKPFEIATLLHEIGACLHLTWRDALTAPGEPTPFFEELLPRYNPAVPPGTELVRLFDLAERGMVADVQRWCAQIEAAAAVYQPFVNRVRHLSNEFQFEEICAFVSRYLEECP